MMENERNVVEGGVVAFDDYVLNGTGFDHHRSHRTAESTSQGLGDLAGLESDHRRKVVAIGEYVADNAPVRMPLDVAEQHCGVIAGTFEGRQDCGHLTQRADGLADPDETTN